MDVEKIYRNRFSEERKLREKNNIWKVLCKHFFQKYIPKEGIIADIGVGYCEFLNNIKAKKKYGIDLNPDSKNYAAEDVTIFNANISDVKNLIKEKVDVVFLSHVLEHLNSKDDVLNTLKSINDILNDKGKVIIFTPNITLLKGRYWDYIDHKVPLNELSIIEAGELNGFKCTKCIRRFLPYTTKSRIPKFKFLIFCYIKLMPLSSFFLGKTSFIILEKADGTINNSNSGI